MKHLACVLRVPVLFVWFVLRVNIQRRQVSVSTTSVQTPRGTGMPVPQTVSCDREKPATKRSAVRLVLPLPHLLSDRGQDVLSNVGRVCILQPLASSEAIHQRRIQPDKLIPRDTVVRIPQPNQQAESRRR